MSDKKSKFAAIGTFVENANPYVKAAATIMKGVSFFKNRSAERKRLRKLGKQYTEDLTSFTDDIIQKQLKDTSNKVNIINSRRFSNCYYISSTGTAIRRWRRS